MTRFTRESLRQYLERACNYTYEGEQLPFPYSGDGPDMFRKPSGEAVSIPQPIGTFYDESDIKKIFEVHKIEAVTSSYVSSASAALAETQEVANKVDSGSRTTKAKEVSNK